MTKFIIILVLVFTTLISCKNIPKEETPSIFTDETATYNGVFKEEKVSYKTDSITFNSFVVYDTSIHNKLPVVMVVHEWWGLNDFIRSRVKELAKLGYLAIAVDLYGKNQVADNTEDASKLAGPIYDNPTMAKRRFDAALNKIKSYSQADTNQIVAMGYCFGGSMVLNFARMGEPFKGVVSFHGNLKGVPITKNVLNQPILICHGDSDVFVNSEVKPFKREMDSIGAKYVFKSYPNATHAFTNPGSTATGIKFSIPIRYNAAADSASWKDMKVFLGSVLGKGK